MPVLGSAGRPPPSMLSVTASVASDTSTFKWSQRQEGRMQFWQEAMQALDPKPEETPGLRRIASESLPKVPIITAKPGMPSGVVGKRAWRVKTGGSLGVLRASESLGSLRRNGASPGRSARSSPPKNSPGRRPLSPPPPLSPEPRERPEPGAPVSSQGRILLAWTPLAGRGPGSRVRPDPVRVTRRGATEDTTPFSGGHDFADPAVAALAARWAELGLPPKSALSSSAATLPFVSRPVTRADRPAGPRVDSPLPAPRSRAESVHLPPRPFTTQTSHRSLPASPAPASAAGLAAPGSPPPLPAADPIPELAEAGPAAEAAQLPPAALRGPNRGSRGSISSGGGEAQTAAAAAAAEEEGEPRGEGFAARFVAEIELAGRDREPAGGSRSGRSTSPGSPKTGSRPATPQQPGTPQAGTPLGTARSREQSPHSPGGSGRRSPVESDTEVLPPDAEEEPPAPQPPPLPHLPASALQRAASGLIPTNRAGVTERSEPINRLSKLLIEAVRSGMDNRLPSPRPSVAPSRKPRAARDEEAEAAEREADARRGEWRSKTLVHRTSSALTPTTPVDSYMAHARSGAEWLWIEEREHTNHALRHDWRVCACRACRLLAGRPEDPEKLLEKERALYWRRKRQRAERRYCASVVIQASSRSFLAKMALWRFRRKCRCAETVRMWMATIKYTNALRAAQLRVRACVRIKAFVDDWFRLLPALRAKYAWIRKSYIRWRAALLLRKFRDVALELRRRTIIAQIKVAAVYRSRLARAALWRHVGGRAAIVIQATWRSWAVRRRREKAVLAWTYLIAAYKIQKWWKAIQARWRLQHMQGMLDRRVMNFWLIIRYGRRWLRFWRHGQERRRLEAAHKVAKSWIRKFRLRRFKNVINHAFARQAAMNAEQRGKMSRAASKIQGAVRKFIARRREDALHIGRLVDNQQEVRRAMNKNGFFAGWPFTNSDRSHCATILCAFKREIRLLYLHYSLFGTQTAQRAVQLLYPRFLSMVEHMDLIIKGPNVGSALTSEKPADTSPQQMDRGAVLSLFVACNRDQPFIARAAGATGKEEDEAQGSKGAVGAKSVKLRQKEEKTFADSKNDAMSLEGFVEALFRLSFAVFPRVSNIPTAISETSERMKRFFKEFVHPLYERCWKEAPWRDRIADGKSIAGVKAVLASHDPALRRLFKKWCKATADADDKNNSKINLTEFLMMVQAWGLIGKGVSYSSAIKAFVYAHGEELERYLTDDGAQASHGFSVRMQMDYEEYVEGICRLAETASRDGVLTDQSLASFLKKILTAG